MTESWTSFCRKKQDYKHAVYYIDYVSCSYYNMTNSQFIAQLSSSDSDSENIEILNILLIQQS